MSKERINYLKKISVEKFAISLDEMDICEENREGLINNFKKNQDLYISYCNSYIEKMLILALFTKLEIEKFSQISNYHITENILYDGQYENFITGRRLIQLPDWDTLYAVIPQYKFDCYRVDFLLLKHTLGINETIITSKIILEADGYDFHSNKHQIQYDRTRERYLQSLGIHVFRFTGSEIFKDPFIVAEEIFKYFKSDKNKVVTPFKEATWLSNFIKSIPELKEIQNG